MNDAGMPLDEFEKVMISAIKSLPAPLKEKLQNVAIIIEDKKKPKDLLGLYEGTPLTERHEDEPWAYPDRIILYKRNLEEMCGDDVKRLRFEIRRTVAHEIAHYFGLSDERLEELGLD